ncbi:MAG: hypothetical protein QG608_360 [Actinomycetota bacterium]|nr:hypothetical protein [Actinomycetota bacterium]
MRIRQRLAFFSAAAALVCGTGVTAPEARADPAAERVRFTVNGPETVQMGQEITLGGTVPHGGPQSLTVQQNLHYAGPRSEISRLTPLTVTTAADGTFSVQVKPTKSGKWSFVVFNDMVIGDLQVTVSGNDAYAWIGSDQERPRVNTPSVVHARMYDNLGAPWQAGSLTVHVRRRDSDRVLVQLPDVATAQDGTFTFPDTPSRAGYTDYFLSWDATKDLPKGASSRSLLVLPQQLLIEASAPQEGVRAGIPFTIRGKVTGDPGASAPGPLTLKVYRESLNTTLPLKIIPVAVTSSDGTFSFTDTVKIGFWQYQIQENSSDHEADPSVLRVKPSPLAMHLSFKPAFSGPMTWNQLSTFTGRATLTEGPLVGKPLRLQMRATGRTCARTWGEVFTTDASGKFTAQIFPACPGDTTVTLFLANHTVDVPSESRWYYTAADSSWKAPQVKKNPRPITFLIGSAPATGNRAVTFGEYSHLDVRVDAPFVMNGPDGTLKLYEQRQGKKRELLESTRLNWIGSLSRTVLTYSPVTYTAVYSGDEGNYAQTIVARFSIRARVRQGLSGRYSLKNGEHLFRTRTTPRLTASVRPAHAKKLVVATLQQNAKGTWKTVKMFYPVMNASGNAAVNLRAGHATGIKYRVRTTWQGDKDHLANSSAWTYFRYTS